MKLTYDQMRLLSEIGDPHGKLTIKNTKGHVLRPALKKWGNKDGKSTFTQEPLRPYHVPTVNRSQTFHRVSC